MAINRIVSPVQWGELTRYEEIEVGRELGPIEWTCNAETLDLLLHCYDLWHEWFVVDSPFGGRVLPPPVLAQVFISLNPYIFRAAAAGLEEECFDVLRLDKKYIFSGKIADKFIKRDKEWVLFDHVCTDEDGRVVVKHKSLLALSFITRQQMQKLNVEAPDVTTIDVQEAYPYAPPVLEPKIPGEWKRGPEMPVSRTSYANKDMPLGADLVPQSTQYTWRRMRDWEQYTYHEFMQWPESAATYNIHTHPDAAHKFGLAAPNIGAPRYSAFVSLMMLSALGEGWLRGGAFSFRFVRQVGLWDFITAKARLVKKESEGNAVRLTFDTWVENQRGEKVLVGLSSGLVPL